MTEKDLIKNIEKLKLEIGKEAKNRLCLFSGNVDDKQKCLELCFCVLVANTSLQKTKKVWESLGGKLLNLDEQDLVLALKSHGYRFYNKRANYIISFRAFLKELLDILKNKKFFEIREWVVKNIKGIGWKEASHFLRNIGYKDFAILDRHVLKMLKEYNIIKEAPKSLNKKIYFEIENKLEKIAKKLNISMAELDLYLFYLSSGCIPEK